MNSANCMGDLDRCSNGYKLHCFTSSGGSVLASYDNISTYEPCFKACEDNSRCGAFFFYDGTKSCTLFDRYARTGSSLPGHTYERVCPRS